MFLEGECLLMASLGDFLGVGDCHDSASVVLGGGLTFAGDAFTFSEERDASLAFLGALACACKAGIVNVVCFWAWHRWAC